MTKPNKETFAEARKRLFREFETLAWEVTTTSDRVGAYGVLKYPYVTNQAKTLRLYFKPQALHGSYKLAGYPYTAGTSLACATSITEDIRHQSAEALVTRANQIFGIKE